MINRRLNCLNDVELFLRRWDDPAHPANRSRPEVQRSPHGNLNGSGESADYSSPVLTPHEDGFWDAVEPGVRRLVELLVERGWVTYTSCEGHDYGAAGLEPTERSVGLLPRNRAESLAIAATLTQAAHECERRASEPEVRVEDGQLTDSLTQARFATLELRFEQGDLGWPEYFDRLDGAYAAFVDAFERSPVIALG